MESLAVHTLTLQEFSVFVSHRRTFPVTLGPILKMKKFTTLNDFHAQYQNSIITNKFKYKYGYDYRHKQMSADVMFQYYKGTVMRSTLKFFSVVPIASFQVMHKLLEIYHNK